MVLGQVCILILINHDVAKLVLVLGELFGKVAEKNIHIHQQIVEVHSAIPKTTFAVGFKDATNLRTVATGIFLLN